MPKNNNERAAEYHARNKAKYPDRTRKNYNATQAEHEKLKLTLDEMREM